MYKKALDLHEDLGSKEGMANAYGNLGNVYRIRGDLAQAEAMLKKALDLDEALGSKQGMANQYGNLGLVYRIRGDLAQAEAMLKKSLELFQDIGAVPQVELVQGWLDGLRKSD